MVEPDSRHLLHEVWREPLMEFYKNIKGFSTSGWFGWDFSVGGFVRIQKRGFQIQLNLIFVEFYLDLYRSRIEPMTDDERRDGLVSPAQTDTQEHPDIGASATSDTLPEYECDHLWVHRAGSGYRANPVELCAKCDTVRRSCPKCGEKL